jgi:hypothetical protein
LGHQCGGGTSHKAHRIRSGNAPKRILVRRSAWIQRLKSDGGKGSKKEEFQSCRWGGIPVAIGLVPLEVILFAAFPSTILLSQICESAETPILPDLLLSAVPDERLHGFAACCDGAPFLVCSRQSAGPLQGSSLPPQTSTCLEEDESMATNREFGVANRNAQVDIDPPDER